MISICNLKSSAQAAGYYEKDDYYSGKECPSKWWGAGAKMLGLSGPVDRDSFRNLLEGRLPDGTELPSAGGARRPGYDLTFSAPKSASLMAFIAGDERILKAHEEAVSESLSWIEKTSSQARTTESDDTRKVGTGNLVVARFEHDTSRELDPLLHSHAVILNATRRPDGKWRAIENSKLYDNRKAADAIYKSGFAERLRRIGYEIEQTHADGRFEIAGITREQIEHFSKRRMQIVAALEERGFSSPAAADVASLDTRKAKTNVDRSALRDLWREQAAAIGLKLEIPGEPGRNPEIESQKEASERRATEARRVAALAVEHFSERASVFPPQDLVQFGLERGTGHTNLRAYEKALAEMTDKGELIRVGDGRYTTEKAIQLEKKILDTAGRGQSVFIPIMTPAKTRRALQETVLTVEQKGAVEAILGSKDVVFGVQGYAGTGKTAMLSTVRDLAKASGYQVRGFSCTATAASILQTEAGIRSETLARHLSSWKAPEGHAGRQKPELWVVDEASMMGTGQAEKLLRLAVHSGARVLLVGDRQQLPSIEAGKPFSILMDRGAMDVAIMKSIMRQKEKELKQAVEQTIQGRGKDAVHTLRGSIVRVEDRDARLTAVADEWLSKSADTGERPLVITGMNVDRMALNDLIREGLGQRGELRGKAAQGDVLVSLDCTMAELREPRTYQPDDVVRFGRQYRSLGVEKGEVASIVSVDMEQSTVRLKTSEGRELDWKPWRLSKVELYSREEREIRAGDLVRWTRNDKDLGRTNGELARVVSVDPDEKSARVETPKGVQELDLSSQNHWEHGYASTIHAAQGKTTDEVLIHMDTSQRKTLGHESWYVAISRAREGVRVYTDDPARLPEAIARSMAQESALEAVERQLETALENQEKINSSQTGEQEIGLEKTTELGSFAEQERFVG